MTSINEELKILQEKANKYENMRERYDNYGKKINEAIAILTDVMKEVDPYLTLKSTRTYSGFDYKGTCSELYDKIVKGLQVSTELLEKTYNIDYHKANYIMKELKKLPSVIERREGRLLILYIQKEI